MLLGPLLLLLGMGTFTEQGKFADMGIYPKIYFLWSHSYCYLFVLAVMHIFFIFELRELKQEPKEIY